MRKLKQISLAVVLMFALGTGAMAGIITTPPSADPPPPSDDPTGGIITTPPSATQPTDPVVTVALELLQTVLSLPRF